jgi:hypothetical protein
MQSHFGTNVLRFNGNWVCKGKRKLVRIVPDQTYAGMWRIELPDGSLTDMVNLTRAKDAAKSAALAVLNA